MQHECFSYRIHFYQTILQSSDPLVPQQRILACLWKSPCVSSGMNRSVRLCVVNAFRTSPATVHQATGKCQWLAMHPEVDAFYELFDGDSDWCDSSPLVVGFIFETIWLFWSCSVPLGRRNVVWLDVLRMSVLWSAPFKNSLCGFGRSIAAAWPSEWDNKIECRMGD